MALTLRIKANVYGKNGSPLEKQGQTQMGRLNYFANTGNTFYNAPEGTSFNGVTCLSVIEVFPTGLRVNSDMYYAVETVAVLVSGSI